MKDDEMIFFIRLTALFLIIGAALLLLVGLIKELVI